VSRWFFAAENEKDTDCPGNITGGVPVPLKLPDSTRGLLSSTFSIVIVVDSVIAVSSSLHDAPANATISTAIDFNMFCFMRD
jgi:hypothetical protein